jgi:hypothetical protein
MSDSHTTIPQHMLPATPKQLQFARVLAARNHEVLPWEVQQDRRALSEWIDVQSKRSSARADTGASSKQVAFAERLARAKRRSVPDECFKSRELMSRWIDSNR